MTARRLLLRLFLRQFVSLEATATGGDAKWAIIAVVSLLAAPGYLAALVAARGSRALAMSHEGRMPPSLWLWKQEWLLLAMSLVSVAAVAAIAWRSFVLTGRDYRILGVLPLHRRTVMAAKVQSLVVVVLLLHVAINALPGLWLPLASPFGYARAALALQAALLLQTVFACSAIVAGQGLVGLVLPARWGRCASSALQFAILLGLALFFVAEGSISRLAFAARGIEHPVNWIVPVVWFRAIDMRLLGVEDAGLAVQARIGWVATALAVAAALLCSLLGYRDASDGGEVRGHGRRLEPWRVGRVLGGSPSPPVARATASFVTAALLRSPSAGLIARGFFVVGVALTVSGLVGLLLGDVGYDAPVIPAAPLHAPAFVLPFFALVGLRLSAVYPAALEASWIFRLTESPGSADYAAGVRRAALLAVILPVLAILAIPYGVAWGAARASAHLLLALLVALVTAEWLFLGFPKIPFTCTYLPGRANLRVTWPRHAAIFFVYCGLVPRLAAWLLEQAWAYAAAVVVLLLVWRWLAGRRESEARAGRLVFDERADPYVTVLGLEWRQAADLRA